VRTCIFVLLLVLSACGAKKPRVAKPPSIGATQTGIASWYGHPYHGRRAASGEVYDMEKYTAAHRTYSFETWVRVENETNGKTVDVRITDRGPFVRGRIIDLSKAAARDIDLIRSGTARVKLTVIDAPAGEIVALFGIHVGAFADRHHAEEIRGRLESKMGSAALTRREGNPPLWRVVGGRFRTQDEASFTLQSLREEFPEAFVVRADDSQR